MHVPNRQFWWSQSASTQHDGRGTVGTHRSPTQRAPSTQGWARSHASPRRCASRLASQTRLVPSKWHEYPARAGGRSGERSTQMRASVFVPALRREPQTNPSGCPPGATPAGRSPPRHTIAPAESAHSHSPSSGNRGCRCTQRSPEHSNSWASRARSQQRRCEPWPLQRTPSSDGNAFGSGAFLTETGAPRPSQHTRSAITSLQVGVVSGAGTKSSRRTTGFVGLVGEVAPPHAANENAKSNALAPGHPSRDREEHAELTRCDDAGVALRVKEEGEKASRAKIPKREERTRCNRKRTGVWSYGCRPRDRRPSRLCPSDP